jgi:hypothetical protein
VRRRWSSRTCRREMVSTRLSELFCRHDEKSPATPKHAASHGGRAAAPMEDGGGNNAREEDGREVPVELAEVPSRTARSLGCCSPHQAVLARDEEGAVRVSRELGGESNRLKTMKRAWPQKKRNSGASPGSQEREWILHLAGLAYEWVQRIKHGGYAGSSGHAFWPKSNTPYVAHKQVPQT